METERLDYYGAVIGEAVKLYFQKEISEVAYQKKVLEIALQAYCEEETAKYVRFDWILKGLSAFYAGHFMSWQTENSDKIAKSLISIYMKDSSRKDVKLLMRGICVPLAKSGDESAIDMLIFLGVHFSEYVLKDVFKHLMELGVVSELHDKVITRMRFCPILNQEGLELLSKIDQSMAYVVCLEWLQQKDTWKKVQALEQLTKLTIWDVVRYKQVLKVLDQFWQSEVLCTNPKATKSYFALVLLAYQYGVIAREEANGLLSKVFTSRGYLYPVERDIFKDALERINPENAGVVYAAGFLRASAFYTSESQNFQPEKEVDDILTALGKSAKNFLRELVITTVNQSILWVAARKYLELASPAEGEEAFRIVLKSNKPELVGDLLQLILRIVSGEDGLGHLRKKWSFLSKLIKNEGEKFCPKTAFARVNQIACFGSEKDLASIIPDLEKLNISAKVDRKEFVRTLLFAKSRLKKKANIKSFNELLLVICRDRDPETLNIIVEAIKHDWRGWRCMEVLAFTALDFVNYYNDDCCIPLIFSAIIDNTQGGDLVNSIKTDCAEFLLKKAISGNKKALDALIAIPSKKIRPTVSSLLVEVVKKCPDEKLRQTAVRAVLVNYRKAVTGSNDLYVHLEMESMEKLRHIREVQEGFLRSLEDGLSCLRDGTGIHNAIKKVAEFVDPAFREIAKNSLLSGLKKAEKSIQDCRYDRRDNERYYNTCLVMVHEQLLGLST